MRRARQFDRRRIRRAFGALLLINAGALLADACSSSPPASVATLSGRQPSASRPAPLTQAQSNRDMLEFAHCLRRHGVDEPDPTPAQGHAGLRVTIPTRGPTTSSALNACRQFLAPIISAKQAGARRELATWMPSLIRYAQCRRAHDVAMLDPNAQGSLDLGLVAGLNSRVGRYSPQFRSADLACRHLLPAAIHDNGTGP